MWVMKDVILKKMLPNTSHLVLAPKHFTRCTIFWNYWSIPTAAYLLYAFPLSQATISSMSQPWSHIHIFKEKYSKNMGLLILYRINLHLFIFMIQACVFNNQEVKSDKTWGKKSDYSKIFYHFQVYSIVKCKHWNRYI